MANNPADPPDESLAGVYEILKRQEETLRDLIVEARLQYHNLPDKEKQHLEWQRDRTTREVGDLFARQVHLLDETTSWLQAKSLQLGQPVKATQAVAEEAAAQELMKAEAVPLRPTDNIPPGPLTDGSRKRGSVDSPTPMQVQAPAQVQYSIGSQYFDGVPQSLGGAPVKSMKSSKGTNYFAILGLVCALATIFIQPETSGPGGLGTFTHSPPSGSEIWIEWLKGILGLAGLILGLLGGGAAKAPRAGRGLAITAIVLGTVFAIGSLSQAAIWSGLTR
jgi:hypothetical protein